jgi:Icc-related predicted phosphoesterase
MIIDCVSDLHGHYPNLEGGDLLIVAGDLTARDTSEQYEKFFTWLCTQDHYRKKVLISGNHDNAMVNTPPKKIENGIYHYLECCEYLCDSGTEFEGLKIWGSPWTKTFPGMNPHCMAFTCDTEKELAKKWKLIPDDADILITHGPAYGFGDEVEEFDFTEIGLERLTIKNVGSTSLGKWIANHAQTLKMHVHGHIHGGYRVWDVRAAKQMCGDTILSPILVNASHVNERYKPVNKPIRVIL